MSRFHVKVGDTSTFTKTVGEYTFTKTAGEYDVYGFAGITGDFSPNHTNGAYMEKSSYGRSSRHGREGGHPRQRTARQLHGRASGGETTEQPSHRLGWNLS